MPIITRISEQRRSPRRRNVYVDGAFAFGCNVNVVARFRLREGLEVTGAQIQEIQLGEVKQECLDAGLKFLQSRLHSTAELRRKLMRGEWGGDVVETTLGELSRLGYLDDERFARTKALSVAQHKHHGPRRAMSELLKAGVKRETASRALDEVYAATDSVETARRLALKQAPRLARLDPVVARRRLAGMLARRGFEYDSIKPVIDEVLGRNS